MEIPDPSKWILTGFVGLVAPWHEKISSIQLISTYYLPSAQVAASLAGAIVGISLLFRVHKDSQTRNRRRLWYSALGFLIFLLFFIALRQTVGVFWQPGEFGLLTLHVLWPVLYVLLNVMLSVIVAFIVAVFWREAKKPQNKKS